MHLPPLFWTHALFLLFVIISVYAQAMTGFAQALILVGLVSATNLLPLPDVVNTATVISFCNGFAILYWRRPLHFERILIPAVITSVIGIVAGALLLGWLAGTAYEVLRLTLGISVIACALLLWRAAKPLPAVSPPATFAAVGGISGLMAGLFSVPGPPLVYLLYRQPLPLPRVQESLILIFALGTILRLGVVIPAGQFSSTSLQLALEALPVVALVSYFAALRPPPLPPGIFKALVCALLLATGIGMISSAAAGMR